MSEVTHDIYLADSEERTMELRFAIYNTYGQPRLQQKWLVRQGYVTHEEWRDVPVIDVIPKE